MDVANRAFRERVGDVPGDTSVRRGINVDRVSRCVVEIIAPIDGFTRHGRDVKRTRAAGDCMRLAELVLAGAHGDDGSGYGADHFSRWKSGECMKTIAEQPRGQAIGYGQCPPEPGIKFCYRLPRNLMRILD